MKKGHWMMKDSILVDNPILINNVLGLRFFLVVARENEINEAGRWFLHATGQGWASVYLIRPMDIYSKCLLVGIHLYQNRASKLLDFIVHLG